MFKFVTIVFAALLACAAAKPAWVAAPAAAYANAPLYAPGGSDQIDIRNNYDGTLSSYATAPFGYAGPFASRYVAGLPAVARYAAAAPFAAPFAAATAPFAAPLAAAPFAAPAAYAAPAPFAAPAAYAAPAPFAAPASYLF